MPTFQDLDSIKLFMSGEFIALFVAIGAMGWRMARLQRRVAAVEAQIAAQP